MEAVVGRCEVPGCRYGRCRQWWEGVRYPGCQYGRWRQVVGRCEVPGVPVWEVEGEGDEAEVE